LKTFRDLRPRQPDLFSGQATGAMLRNWARMVAGRQPPIRMVFGFSTHERGQLKVLPDWIYPGLWRPDQIPHRVSASRRTAWIPDLTSSRIWRVFAGTFDIPKGGPGKAIELLDFIAPRPSFECARHRALRGMMRASSWPVRS